MSNLHFHAKPYAQWSVWNVSTVGTFISGVKVVKYSDGGNIKCSEFGIHVTLIFHPCVSFASLVLRYKLRASFGCLCIYWVMLRIARYCQFTYNLSFHPTSLHFAFSVIPCSSQRCQTVQTTPSKSRACTSS